MNARAAIPYEGVAQAWDAGPSVLYDALARAIIDEYPEPLRGQRILDIGAGTGAISRALQQRGAIPVGLDAAPDMVDLMKARGIDAVVGDLLALPFPDNRFDGAVAAFSLSHVDRPDKALTEAARVVRPGGRIIIASFAATQVNTSKDVVDTVAARFGYVKPAWYIRLKNETEPMTNTASSLRACARRARLESINVIERTVDAAIDRAPDIVAVRLGMGHLAPFVSSLSGVERQALIDEAQAAVGDPMPLCPSVLVMSARAGR